MSSESVSSHSSVVSSSNLAPSSHGSPLHQCQDRGALFRAGRLWGRNAPPSRSFETRADSRSASMSTVAASIYSESAPAAPHTGQTGPPPPPAVPAAPGMVPGVPPPPPAAAGSGARRFRPGSSVFKIWLEMQQQGMNAEAVHGALGGNGNSFLHPGDPASFSHSMGQQPQTADMLMGSSSSSGHVPPVQQHPGYPLQSQLQQFPSGVMQQQQAQYLSQLSSGMMHPPQPCPQTGFSFPPPPPPETPPPRGPSPHVPQPSSVPPPQSQQPPLQPMQPPSFHPARFRAPSAAPTAFSNNSLSTAGIVQPEMPQQQQQAVRRPPPATEPSQHPSVGTLSVPAPEGLRAVRREREGTLPAIPEDPMAHVQISTQTLVQAGAGGALWPPPAPALGLDANTSFPPVDAASAAAAAVSDDIDALLSLHPVDLSALLAEAEDEVNNSGIFPPNSETANQLAVNSSSQSSWTSSTSTVERTAGVMLSTECGHQKGQERGGLANRTSESTQTPVEVCAPAKERTKGEEEGGEEEVNLTHDDEEAGAVEQKGKEKAEEEGEEEKGGHGEGQEVAESDRSFSSLFFSCVPQTNANVVQSMPVRPSACVRDAASDLLSAIGPPPLPFSCPPGIGTAEAAKEGSASAQVPQEEQQGAASASQSSSAKDGMNPTKGLGGQTQNGGMGGIPVGGTMGPVPGPTSITEWGRASLIVAKAISLMRARSAHNMPNLVQVHANPEVDRMLYRRMASAPMRTQESQTAVDLWPWSCSDHQEGAEAGPSQAGGGGGENKEAEGETGQPGGAALKRESEASGASVSSEKPEGPSASKRPPTLTDAVSESDAGGTAAEGEKGSKPPLPFESKKPDQQPADGGPNLGVGFGVCRHDSTSASACWLCALRKVRAVSAFRMSPTHGPRRVSSVAGGMAEGTATAASAGGSPAVEGKKSPG
uniref:Uncharacterized protein n=1 Tax=Chromera velia CCMP2878 TaxID=1169474 RepID=A0A0G4EZH3_9ALVE|eukprot:Cvel_14408.t1-p1 / transcript=Cvel_14408.t1 / gene=Cvel_14408 / organism=Chromera_velia_CCMP2878 / gene_product=hypothetical protein / transcript_product=hypothetical protein / location=Cvel_scaffold1024:16341-19441(-) / protein_length=933 / sequence_SO=supercontig / SO=protein_coding / is_pseudo=false